MCTVIYSVQYTVNSLQLTKHSLQRSPALSPHLTFLDRVHGGTQRAAPVLQGKSNDNNCMWTKHVISLTHVTQEKSRPCYMKYCVNWKSHYSSYHYLYNLYGISYLVLGGLVYLAELFQVWKRSVYTELRSENLLRLHQDYVQMCAVKLYYPLLQGCGCPGVTPDPSS